MRAAVADATVLIYLAKLGELDRLERRFDAVLVPAAVHEEVVERGRAEGYRDALAVEAAADDGLEVVSLADDVAATAERLRDTADLGRGEAAAIALAQARAARCLTDDHAARTTAAAVGVEVGGTIYVLLDALDAGTLSYDEYVRLIDGLSDAGFRMSASLYRRALDAGEAIVADE